MRCLITGCAGFIGSHLTEALLADGVSVLGIDCFNDNYGRDRKLANLRHAQQWESFEFLPLDLARGELHDVLEECDRIVHLAAEPGVRSSWGPRFDWYLRNNVVATQQLLEAAKDVPEKRFVYASSSSIYGQAESFPTPETATPNPISPYGVTKLTAEHLAHCYHVNHGVDVVSLRFFSVYGPRQRPDMAFDAFCRAALEGRPITVYGDGLQTRDFTYVGDIVDGLRAALTLPDVSGRIYNLGGGSQIGLNDAIATLSKVAGRRIDVHHLPREHGDVKDTGSDITRAAAELAFAPKTTLDAGLQQQFEWVASTYDGELVGS
jgi:UDP-glucuronate 4-epimerase